MPFSRFSTHNFSSSFSHKQPASLACIQSLHWEPPERAAVICWSAKKLAAEVFILAFYWWGWGWNIAPSSCTCSVLVDSRLWMTLLQTNWWHPWISAMTWFHAACWNLPPPSHSFFPSLFPHLPLSLSSPSLSLSLCFSPETSSFWTPHCSYLLALQPHAHEESEAQVSLYCGALWFHTIVSASFLFIPLDGVILPDQGLVLQKRRQELHCMNVKTHSASWIIYCSKKLEIFLQCYRLV